MGRVLSFGLDRVLGHIVVISAARARARALGHPASRALPTGQRRILEHVAMTSLEKRLKMPR